MNRIEDLFDKINPIVEEFELNKDEGALLMLGADFENECGIIQGKVKSLVAMIISRMEAEKEMEFIILKSAEHFLARKEREADKKEN